MRERAIEAAVCRYAKSRGWQSIKLNGPGDRGQPDRLFFAAGGRVKFVEFKAPGKKPRRLQELFLRRLARCDFDCFVIDNVAEGKALFD
jgi:hypothetical protein